MTVKAKLPTVSCDVVKDEGGHFISIVIGGIDSEDETIALVRSLAMPLATAITQFYKQPPPKKCEFLTGDYIGSGSLH